MADKEKYREAMRSKLFGEKLVTQSWNLDLSGKCPFEILGLNPADFEEMFEFKIKDSNVKIIADRYRELSRKAHPDKGGDPNDMVKLNWAIKILSDTRWFLNYTLVRKTLHGCDGFKEAISVMRLYSEMDIYRPVEDEKLETMTDFMVFFATGNGYDRVMPCDEWIAVMAEKTNMKPEFIRQWWIENLPFVDGTPMKDLVEHIRSYWDRKCKEAADYLNSTIEYVKESVIAVLTYKKEIASVLGVIGLGYFAWSNWKVLFEPQTARKVRSGTKPTKKTTFRTIPRKGNKELLVEQQLVVTENLENVWNSMRRNLYVMTPRGGSTVMGWVVFLARKVALVLNHMVSAMSYYGYEAVTLHSVFDAQKFDVPVSEFVEGVSIEGDLNDDIVFAHLTSMGRDARSITHLFLDRGVAKTSVLHQSHYGTLLKPSIKFVDGNVVEKGMISYAGFAKPIVPKTYGSEEKWKVGDGIVYDVKTVEGDCGLPWAVTDAKALQPFIGGIHVAGSGSTGITACVYRDAVNAALSEFLGDSYVPEAEEKHVEESNVQLPEGWRVIKTLPHKRVGTVSRLQKTKMHNLWSESDKRPAMMRPTEIDGKIVDPMVSILKPYGVPKIKYNVELIKDLARAYVKKIHSVSKSEPWEPRLFSVYEATAGIPGFVKGIPRNTSAGYPWSEMSKKKFAFFGKEGDYEYTSESCRVLLDKVEADIKMLYDGQIPEWFYALFIKDELRSLQKYLVGKSRGIMGSPLDKTIVTAVLFKDFFRWLQDNRIFNGVAFGINPTSSEWLVLKRFITMLSPYVIAGDYKNWDGNQPDEFDEGFLIVCESYYWNSTEEERLARRLIIKDTGHPRVVMTLPGTPELGFRDSETIVAQVDDIEPSGDLTTTPKNSINNNLRSAYVRAHLVLQRKGFGGAMDYTHDPAFCEDIMRDNYIALGDDHLLNIIEERKWMTEKVYARGNAECNFEYTTSDKGKDFKDELKTIKDASFLKRIWLQHAEYPGVEFAALELDVILQMSYWVEKGAPPNTTADTIDVTAKELSAWGFEKYREYAWTIAVDSRKLLNHISEFLPMNNSEEECLLAWHRAVAGYRSMDFLYL